MSTLTVELAKPEPLDLQVASAFESNKIAITEVQKLTELTVATHGIGKVTAGRKAVKNLRIEIDKRRKELNEAALETQRAVNSYAKELTAEIVPVEEYLKAEEDAHEKAKEDAKQLVLAAKRAILTGRLERLAKAGCTPGDITAIEVMSDEAFETHYTSEAMKAESAREQAEAAKLAAEKLEAERLAEIARQAEELRIRSEEMEAERKALAAEREAMLHQQQLERRQIEEQQAALRAQQEELRKSDELKAESERNRMLAERVAESNRLAEIARAEAAATEAARLEARKPELEKLDGFMKSLDYWADKHLAEIGRPWWSEVALVQLEQSVIEIRRRVEQGE